MITERQKELLKIIVESYIKTVKPVGSKAICEYMKCSSATIRNEMAFLEETGYLEKTHTSSGRIPSDKGYRYYVDNIMVPKDLSGEDMLKLQTIFTNNSLLLDDAIVKSMEIVSELTNYTAIVLGENAMSNRVAKVEVVPLDNNKLTALVITDKGHVESRNISLDSKISSTDIKQTVEIINKVIVGVPLVNVSQVLEFEVKPVIAKYVKQHDEIYNAFYNAFSDFVYDPEVKVKGTNKLLSEPEFNDIEKMRKMLNKFEDKNLINTINSNADGIYIGSENNIDEDVSIVKTYYTKDGTSGTIALIGPKRMQYDRARALLNYIKENIGKGE